MKWQPLLLTKTYIEKELKAKNHVILISCDLAKAFDTCRTDGILQNKVKYYCKGKKTSSWISSYYEHRNQYTVWNSEKSNVKENFPISIVQGSSLGPRMFNVYLNDIVSCSKFFKVMFADDTNFLLSMKNSKELETVANEELQIIYDYFISNGLTISVKKTSFIHFSPKGKKKESINLKIGNQALNEVSELKFLGITLDKSLNFNTHFQNTYKKALHGLRGLILTKNFLTYKAKCAIYHSLIHTHLAYCSIIWINEIKKGQLNQLKKLQKKAIRVIFNKRYNSHTGELFKQSGITKIENMFLTESVKTIHKFHNKNLPRAIQNMIKESLDNPNLLTRSMSNCTLQPKREMIGTTIFKVLENWNELGNSTRDIKSYKEFKKCISKELNENYEICIKENCYSCKP